MNTLHGSRRGRGPGRLAVLLLALVTLLGIGAGTAPAAPGRHRVPVSALDAVAAMQPSWNLGNTLDAIPARRPGATRRPPGNCCTPSARRASAASASR